MPRSIQAILLSSIMIFLAGCYKSVDVGGGYTISAPRSPDGQHHGNSLYYKGAKVFDNVAMQQYHEGLLLFLSEGNRQVYVIRSSGPAVMLSERIVTKVNMVGGLFPGEPSSPMYSVENLTRTADGVRLKFFTGVDEKTGAYEYETHDLTWPAIQDFLREAEASEPVHNSPQGNYRVLHKAAPTSSPKSP